LEVVELNHLQIIHLLQEEGIQLHLHVKLFQLLQQVAEVEDRVKVVEDLEAEEFQFITKQEIQVIHLLHHHHKVILEDLEEMLEVQQITEAEVAEAMEVLEVMPIMEMMEHQEQEQQILLQEHL
jgi:hypothetical protein